jgi:hypothetical protein
MEAADEQILVFQRKYICAMGEESQFVGTENRRNTNDTAAYIFMIVNPKSAIA